MKEFRYTTTVNIFIIADNEEEAESKFEDMEIEFYDPDTNELLQSDLIDYEMLELDSFDDIYEEPDYES